MTKKRFNNVGGYLYDGDECIGHYHDVRFRDDVVECLNELHEENEKLNNKNKQLKEDNILLIDDSENYRKLAIQFDNRNKELVRENALLEKENEQLKQQLRGILKSS